MPKIPSPNYFFALRFDTTSSMHLKELQKSILWPSEGFLFLLPESFHLTLRFVGPAAPDTADTLIQLLKKTTGQGIHIPALRVTDLLPLPSVVAARVVAAAVAPDPALSSLVEAFDTVLRATEQKKQNEPARAPFRFLPHVTLARISQTAELHPLKLRALLEPVLRSPVKLFSLRASEIALLRTERSQGITSYVPVSSYALT